MTHIAFSSDSNHLALAHADRSLCLYRWKVGVEEMGLFLILLNLSSVVVIAIVEVVVVVIVLVLPHQKLAGLPYYCFTY